MPQTQISPGILNEPSLRRSKQFVSFFLKLLNRDLAAGVGLQVGIEVIVLLHGGFPICAYTRAEFLKVHADPIERQATATVGTFNSAQLSVLVNFLRIMMNSRASSIDENILSLLRELQG
jgi:hypothetical protein